MLELHEEQLDRITEVFYRILAGEKPQPVLLPPDAPEDEYSQVVSYLNRFIEEHNQFAEFMYSLSRGELHYTPPKGRMRVLQSFKSLQASLKHLTWKTQQIAGGDFSQKVDFMGDFSDAFNLMTHQLEKAFADLEQANQELADKNKHITDSIRYAQRIQQAILPTQAAIREALDNDFFVIFYPLSIVSGDFYWLTRIQDDILLAAVDCTGHGVSGAFLTMIGHTLLNKIVKEDQIIDPAQILLNLSIGVRNALQQETGDTRDGMDVCLCRIHADRQQVTFAGARRPLYSISQQQIQEIKGDRLSIGGKPPKKRQEEFTNHDIFLAPGDTLYLSSDGFADQPNPAGKAFGSKQLKTLLNKVSGYSLTEQEARILAELHAHQQDKPQRDDITLLGVRL
ncbi:MAG: SpoIIE family protein phosphatase [Candidatus Electrothrix scaldis]|nr:MAG: SpoIIE family protein phosphatase [Candidatus Electrothrix sp. GW3-3]